MSFKEINPNELQGNPFTLIGTDWMLITAGNETGFNTMTASWGGLGILWGKPVATAYIRPQRYTKTFVDANDFFTLSFFPDGFRAALNLCGTVSGRDTDKVKQAGLTPYFTNGTTAFEESKIVLVCRKLYHDDIKPENFEASDDSEKWYPEMDYHTMYIAEIVKILVRE